MARLSNFPLSGDAPGQDPPLVCRPAARAEIEQGLRLILAGDSGPADDEAVLDFLSFAVQRRIDVNAMWVAEQSGRVVWALLPLPSPGRTMLLFSPSRTFRQTPVAALRLLCDAVCDAYRAQHVELAQVLLDPRQHAVSNLYRQAHFEQLAELWYLHRSAHRTSAPPLPGREWELVTYSPGTHEQFSTTIARSYEHSLDCPALNGRREMTDIIAGHQATGRFDPSMWYVLAERGVGRGALLLNPALTGDSAELVYLGLAVEARGRGLGDLLMRQALHSTASRGYTDLSLAVDSHNQPALKLYYRHGMKRVGARLALIRDLRRLD